MRLRLLCVQQAAASVVLQSVTQLYNKLDKLVRLASVVGVQLDYLGDVMEGRMRRKLNTFPSPHFVA